MPSDEVASLDFVPEVMPKGYRQALILINVHLHKVYVPCSDTYCLTLSLVSVL